MPMTDEAKKEIEMLISQAAKTNAGTMISNRRYAVNSQKNLVLNGRSGFRPIEVTRYIKNYGDGNVVVQDLIKDCVMYAANVLKETALIPVSEKEIANYGTIIEIVVDDMKNNERKVYILK